MSGSFERYEHEYTAVSTSISRKIKTKLTQETGEQKKQTARSVEKELGEANEIIQAMEFEVSSLPTAQKNRLQPRLKNFKTDYEALRADFNRSISRVSDREELFSGAQTSYDNDAMESDTRALLINQTNRLNKTGNQIQDIHRVALETEQSGINTLGMLRSQREQLERGNRNLDETNSFIDRNVRILKSMGRRMATNRIMSIAIIIVLIIIIILILVVKFG